MKSVSLHEASFIHRGFGPAELRAGLVGLAALVTFVLVTRAITGGQDPGPGIRVGLLIFGMALASSVFSAYRFFQKLSPILRVRVESDALVIGDQTLAAQAIQEIRYRQVEGKTELRSPKPDTTHLVLWVKAAGVRYHMIALDTHVFGIDTAFDALAKRNPEALIAPVISTR